MGTSLQILLCMFEYSFSYQSSYIMLKIQSGNIIFNIDFDDARHVSGTIGDEKFKWSILPLQDNSFHIIKNYCSYTAEIVNVNRETKTMDVKVNNTVYTMKVNDRYDELIHQMGFDKALSQKLKELKAPMPGLVVEVLAQPGAAVKPGDALLVLEAMKMENLLKSPGDGVVKAIKVKKGNAVEKGQVLIVFE